MEAISLIILALVISTVFFAVLRFPKWRILSFVLSALFFILLMLDASTVMFLGAFFWKFHYLLIGLYIALFGMMIAYLVFGISKNKRYGKIAFILGGVFILVYGMINMSFVSAKEVILNSEKVSRPHKFVFLSDTHEQRGQSFRALRKAVDEINKIEDVEFVVLGGDITDDYSSKEELIETYSILGNLNAPTYFIHGNHDLQSFADAYAKGRQYSEEEHEDAVTSNGITILKDEYIEISEDFVILGRMDRSYTDIRKDFDSIENPNPKACSIAFDHQPLKPYEKEISNRSDFQISGHTHAGQFWPLSILYKLIDYNIKGFYSHGDTVLYVSPGFAGWGMPFRTEAHCQYEVFTLE